MAAPWKPAGFGERASNSPRGRSGLGPFFDGEGADGGRLADRWPGDGVVETPG